MKAIYIETLDVDISLRSSSFIKALYQKKKTGLTTN